MNGTFIDIRIKLSFILATEMDTDREKHGLFSIKRYHLAY